MNELFTLVLRLAIFTVVIIFLVALFISFRSTTHGRFADRDIVQYSENLYLSDLVSHRTIFKKDALDTVKNSKIEYFAKTCDKGSLVKITDLSNGNAWEFGYKPNKKVRLSETTMNAIAGIMDEKKLENYESADEASMLITLYDSYTTRITCEIEKAFLSKEIQTSRAPCLFDGLTKDCGLEISQIGDELCLKNPSSSGPADCRSFKIPFIMDDKFRDYDAVNIGDEKLSKFKMKAYPLKVGAAGTDCDALKTDLSNVALEKDDEMGSVRLCLEEI
ncbi:MAG: hypothetical protein HY513_05595 [Candidatus Aenigmarchaeota archaeon]|nr:hypothetical protein [Candidatus Aenigmarchaeota archaeon]